MSLASALLLLGAAAYLVGSLVAATALDYRELPAVGQGEPSAEDGDFFGGGSDQAGGSAAGLLAAEQDALGRHRSGSGGDEESGGGGAGGSLLPSPDRPLLPSTAARSS